MKKLRKLHLNAAQPIQAVELEKIYAGRSTVTLWNHCTCTYIGDFHTRYCLSANCDVATVLSVAGVIKTAGEIGSFFGPYGYAIGTVVGIYGGAQLMEPSFDKYKMLATSYNKFTGSWNHAQLFY